MVCTRTKYVSLFFLSTLITILTEQTSTLGINYPPTSSSQLTDSTNLIELSPPPTSPPPTSDVSMIPTTVQSIPDLRSSLLSVHSLNNLTVPSFLAPTGSGQDILSRLSTSNIYNSQQKGLLLPPPLELETLQEPVPPHPHNDVFQSSTVSFTPSFAEQLNDMIPSEQLFEPGDDVHLDIFPNEQMFASTSDVHSGTSPSQHTPNSAVGHSSSPAQFSPISHATELPVNWRNLDHISDSESSLTESDDIRSPVKTNGKNNGSFPYKTLDSLKHNSNKSHRSQSSTESSDDGQCDGPLPEQYANLHAFSDSSSGDDSDASQQKKEKGNRHGPSMNNMSRGSSDTPSSGGSFSRQHIAPDPQKKRRRSVSPISLRGLGSKENPIDVDEVALLFEPIMNREYVGGSILQFNLRVLKLPCRQKRKRYLFLPSRILQSKDIDPILFLM